MLGFGISEEALAWVENPEWAERYAGIDFRPPQAVADAAARGLELRKKFKRGGLSPQEAGKAGIGSGVTRATSLKNRQQLSPETIGRMVSYFARHEVDLRSEAARRNTEPTAGEIAWLLWGGNPGRSWAESVKRQMERAEEKGKADHAEADETLDFTVCERSGGTRYGIAGGKQCRKGREVSREEVIGELQKLGIVKNQKQVSRLGQLNDKQLASVAELAKAKQAEKATLSGLKPEQKEAVRKVAKTKEAAKEDEFDRGESEQLTKSLVTLYNNSSTGKAKGGQALYPPEVAKKYAEFQKTDQLGVTKRKISDEELDTLWGSLDQKTKTAMKGKGKPPAEIKKDEERGKRILRHLVETGFRDEITGQPYSWRELQPDHKRAITTFPKDKRGDVEKGDNLVMTHAGYNGFKGSAEQRSTKAGLQGAEAEKFIKDALAKEYTRQGSLTRQQFEAELGSKLNAASAKQEQVRQIKENSALWDKAAWKDNIAAGKGDDLKVMMSAIGDRDGVSGRFLVQNRSRGGEYYYPATAVRQVALLMNRGVPASEWPPGLMAKAQKALRSDLDGRVKRNETEGVQGYEKDYVSRFTAFSGAGKVPQELQAILDEY